MLENVSVGVVDGARVKCVLGVSVRPRRQGRGFNGFTLEFGLRRVVEIRGTGRGERVWRECLRDAECIV